MGPDRIEGPAGRQLTPQRRDILGHLNQVSTELAEVYKAALWLLDDCSMPARGRLLAHTARELINRLPDYLDVPITAKRVDYAGAVDRIAVLWEDNAHREVVPGTMVDGPIEDSTVAAGAEIVISKRLDSEIGSLVQEHRRSGAIREERFASVLQPPEQSGPPFAKAQLEPFTRQWKELGRWFAGHAHVPNPGTKALDFGECASHFETLEHILYTRLCPFYGAVEELDDILEETNRPTG